VWYSSTNIVAAQQWHDEIGAALARCTWFVVVLSPGSVASPWVKRELLHVLNEPRYHEHIVPVLYRPCNWSALSWTLNQIQRIDFRKSFDEGSRALLKVWGRRYVQVSITSRGARNRRQR
jgi:TIR domain-containing protein